MYPNFVSCLTKKSGQVILPTFVEDMCPEGTTW